MYNPCLSLVGRGFEVSGGVFLCDNPERWLLPPPKVERPLVVLSARATVDLDVGAVWRALRGELGKRSGRRMVVLAVRVVLLARPAVARPLGAAVVDLEVVKVPEAYAGHVLVAKRRVNVARDDAGLVLQGP